MPLTLESLFLVLVFLMRQKSMFILITLLVCYIFSVFGQIKPQVQDRLRHLLIWFHLIPSWTEHLIGSFVKLYFVQLVRPILMEPWVINEYWYIIDLCLPQTEPQISHFPSLVQRSWLQQLYPGKLHTSWNMKPWTPVQIFRLCLWYFASRAC